MPLTISVEHAAEVLGITASKLRTDIKKKKIAVLKVGGEMRVSVFVLAKLLGTSPSELLELLEDQVLVRSLEEAERGEMLSKEEALARYRLYIEKAA